MNLPWLLARLLVIAVSLQLSAFRAEAQTSSSAVSIANGGAGRASVEAADVSTLNPAMLVHLRNRDLHSFATKDSWSVGISDNSPDIVVPAALLYTKSRFGEGVLQTESEDVRLTLAGYLGRRVSMGVTGSQRGFHRGGMDWRQVNADFGVSVIASEKLGFAFVGYDLMKANEEIPEDLRATPRGALGVNYLYNDFFRLRLDHVSGRDNDFGEGSTMFGYEALLNSFVAVRLGYGTDSEADLALMTVGLGLNLPRFRLNYAYATADRGVYEARHSVDLGIPF